MQYSLWQMHAGLVIVQIVIVQRVQYNYVQIILLLYEEYYMQIILYYNRIVPSQPAWLRW